MKLLITTRADSTVNGWANLTHPIFKNYANKVGADFLILDEEFNCEPARAGIGDGLWHFRIMEHYNLHEEYDRIIQFDGDTLITPSCPNLFEHVPYDHIGTVYEDVGTRAPARRQWMQRAQQLFGPIGWNSGYINTGVFVTSRCHRDIFRPINGKFYTDHGTDDVHIGYQIKKHNFKVLPLSYRFNHMTMFSEPWNGSPDRFGSHIIHYAGRGVFDEQDISPAALYKHQKHIDYQECKLEQARLDHKRLYGADS
jgi:lipopolysaccharide biosynthesis glycosyltransferase